MTSPRKPLASLSSLSLLGSNQSRLNDWSCPPRLVPYRICVYRSESADESADQVDSTNVGQSVAITVLQELWNCTTVYVNFLYASWTDLAGEPKSAI